MTLLMVRARVMATVLSLALAARLDAQVPAGPEFRVNSHTTFGQTWPSLGVTRDGGFVVTWASREQDGSHYGMIGQRYDARGVRLGGEFQVNTYTTGPQASFPQGVAALRDGSFVVVWDSAYQYWILGQRFDRQGMRAGGEFPANVNSTVHTFEPAVGGLPDGGFVLVWSQPDAEDVGLFGQRFDQAGARVGPEFQVNTFTPGAQRKPSIGADAAGRFVVAWVSVSGQDGSDYGIFGQRFDSQANRIGGEFQVNTYTTLRQDAPSIAARADGGFVVAWEDSTLDGGSDAIVARLYTPTGVPIGPEFIVNQYTTERQRIPVVAAAANGDFVVAWVDVVDNGSYGISARRFNANGTPRGPDFRVNSYSPDAQHLPVVGVDEVGNIVAAWMSWTQDGSHQGIYAQRYGGLRPLGLAVDTAGNRVLEPGEAVDVRPAWRNVNGAAFTFAGTLTSMTGPAGPTYTITDSAGNYGTVANGATASCSDCYGVSVSSPPTRPGTHWDAAAVESITPTALGQRKSWTLHVGDSFTDVPSGNPFYPFVETLLHQSVTGGCSPTQFCPGAPTARAQMAVFVLASKEGPGYGPPACTTPVFSDVPASSPFCPFVEELARRGVVNGCGGGMYCPDEAVTREQMAVFVGVTFGLSLYGL